MKVITRNKILNICVIIVLMLSQLYGCKKTEVSDIDDNQVPDNSSTIDTIPDPRGTLAYGLISLNGQDCVYFNNVDSINKAIIIANEQDVPVYVHNGEYTTLVSSSPKRGFIGSGKIRYNRALIYSSETDYIGIPQNLEEKIYQYPNLLTSGDIISPPLASITSRKSVDILAHFYNDFGLAKTALSANQANGSFVWYDWRWNFSSNYDYDPSRHPLLGWYRGDDPKVLDWICYWLVKYGIRGVILTNNFRTVNWEDPADKSHWYYQLFNNVPNFKNLTYAVWLAANHGISEEEAITMDNDMISGILSQYKNVYFYEKNGKKYPVFYAWDMEGFRGTYDNYNGAVKSVERLKNLAKRCKDIGFDGICVYGRNLKTGPGVFNLSVLEELKRADVYLFSQEYSTTYMNTGFIGSYFNYSTSAQYPTDKFKILNVVTSGKTHSPHPSNWNLGGSTPSLFKQALRRAVDVTKASFNKPKTVVIYNVSEWAEAGPGLIPNQKDLFGYLEAVATIK